MKKPRGIFFDWDGTLADSYYFLEEAHNHTRQAVGFPPFDDGEFALRYFGQPREKLYKDLYAPHQEKARGIFEAFVREHHLKIKPLPDAEALLDIVSGMEIPMGVVSNKKPEFIRKEIAHFGWEDYFKESIVGAGEAAQDKPAADPLLLAIKRAGGGINTGDIWYVGDTETDLSCARNMGCVSIFLNHMPHDDVLVRQYQPDLVIKNCKDLCGFLLQNYTK